MNFIDFIKVFQIEGDKENKNLYKEVLAYYKENESKRSFQGHVSRLGKSTLDKDSKNVRQIHLNPDDKIYKSVFEMANKHVELYSSVVPLFPSGQCLLEEFSIKCYKKNEGFHKPHIDTGRGKTFTRLIACIWYLNDVLEGGVTSFPNQAISIPAKENTLLMFPCNYFFPHQGEKPISNDRYVMTYFVYAADANGKHLNENIKV